MKIYYYTSALLSAHSSLSIRYSIARKEQVSYQLLYYSVTPSHSITSSSFIQNMGQVSHGGFIFLCLTSYTSSQQRYTLFLSISRENKTKYNIRLFIQTNLNEYQYQSAVRLVYHHLETISITNQVVSDIPKAHDTSPITYEVYSFEGGYLPLLIYEELPQTHENPILF